MIETKIDLSKYHNALSRRHQLVRLLWSVVWGLFARPLPRSMGSGWKRLLLRLFGAKIHPTAIVYSSAKVYYPANLEMEAYCCLASDVDCYNVAPIHIGSNTTVSQGAYLCTASHDITNPLNPLITAPIVIEDQAWIGAKAFVGMGVTIGQGAVVGATASVYKNVEPWTVVGGNPAKFIKMRTLTEIKIRGG
jgi:acetyltransferase, cysE/lacA/lpxA/nodL family